MTDTDIRGVGRRAIVIARNAVREYSNELSIFDSYQQSLVAALVPAMFRALLEEERELVRTAGTHS